MRLLLSVRSECEFCAKAGVNPTVRLQRCCCSQITGYSDLWLKHEAEDIKKSGAGLQSIKQANDAKLWRMRLHFGHCSTKRIGNTSTVVITSANHIMAVLLALTRSLTHQIPVLCFCNKHQNKETTPLAKINFWFEYSFVLSLFSLPPLDCCLSSTYRQEQQTPEPLTLRVEAARSSETSE